MFSGTYVFYRRTARRLLPTGWSSCSSRSVIMYLRAVAPMSRGPWNSGLLVSDGSAAAVPLQHADKAQYLSSCTLATHMRC